MILGIFSDSHDNGEKLHAAKQVFEQKGVDETIFCGDLVSPFTLQQLATWPWKISAVFGNNEGDKWGIVRRFKKYNITNIVYPERGYIHELEIDNRHIFVFHGHLPEVTKLAVESGKYDVVCTGHTHESHATQVGSTLWINPGSVTGQSENHPSSQSTIAILNLNSLSSEIIELNL